MNLDGSEAPGRRSARYLSLARVRMYPLSSRESLRKVITYLLNACVCAVLLDLANSSASRPPTGPFFLSRYEQL